MSLYYNMFIYKGFQLFKNIKTSNTTLITYYNLIFSLNIVLRFYLRFYFEVRRILKLKSNAIRIELKQYIKEFSECVIFFKNIAYFFVFVKLQKFFFFIKFYEDKPGIFDLVFLVKIFCEEHFIKYLELHYFFSFFLFSTFISFFFSFLADPYLTKQYNELYFLEICVFH